MNTNELIEYRRDILQKETRIKQFEEQLEKFTITAEQLSKLFNYLMDNNKEGSFRYIIYDIMGLKVEDGAYTPMWLTNLASFRDYVYELREKAGVFKNS